MPYKDLDSGGIRQTHAKKLTGRQNVYLKTQSKLTHLSSHVWITMIEHTFSYL